MDEETAALAVGALPGITGATMVDIARRWRSYLAFLDTDESALPPVLANALTCYRREHDQCRCEAEVERQRLTRRGFDLLALTGERYPVLLREICRPPPLLYILGDAACLDLPQLAIVGSRNASRAGLDHAHRFAAALSGAGFTVTSGLALGIDGAAHWGALEAGRTLAVLGCGADVVYPRRHRQLRAQLLDSGGALVSEFPPGTPARAAHFPQRNRIIAGLSLGTLVVEAAPRSGSLITARFALEQGREVFAMPGSVHNPLSRGCHQLIREGATLVESVDDLAEQLGAMLAFKGEEASSPSPPADDEARRILDAMGFDPLDADSLARVTGLDPAVLTGRLTLLELDGWLECRGGRYQRLR